MKFHLRSYDNAPPGRYCFPGFQCQPMIEALARQVQSFRSGNNEARPSYRECLEDVDSYNCQRLGNNPAFCIPCNPDEAQQIALAANAPGLQPCAGCGAVV